MASAQVIFKGHKIQFKIGSYNKEFTRDELKEHLEKYYDAYTGIHLSMTKTSEEFSGYFLIPDENKDKIEDPDTNLKALFLYLPKNYREAKHSTKSVVDHLFYFLVGNEVETEDSFIISIIPVTGKFEVPLVAPPKKGGKTRRKYKRRKSAKKIKRRKSYKKI